MGAIGIFFYCLNPASSWVGHSVMPLLLLVITSQTLLVPRKPTTQVPEKAASTVENCVCARCADDHSVPVDNVERGSP